MNRLRSESTKTLNTIIRGPLKNKTTKSRITCSYQHLKTNRNIASFKSIRDVVSKRLYATNTPTNLKGLSESFLNGTSAYYVEEMYEAWKSDPSSVHVSWAAFFKNMESGAIPGEAWVSPPTLGQNFSSTSSIGSGSSDQIESVISRHYKLMAIVRAYQVRGHELATIDPLGILHREKPKELQLETYGLSEKDLDTEYFLAPGLYQGALGSKPRRTLREVLSILEQTYCHTIGVEYMHIQSREQSNWIRERMELEQPYKLSSEEKIVLLDRLMWANNFETFLKTKYVAAKRYVHCKLVCKHFVNNIFIDLV